MDREKLIKQIMEEAEADGEPVTRSEAEEMADMEIKAKGIKNYAQAETVKTEKRVRERKVDLDKKAILEIVAIALLKNGYQTTMEMNVPCTLESILLS